MILRERESAAFTSVLVGAPEVRTIMVDSFIMVTSIRPEVRTIIVDSFTMVTSISFRSRTKGESEIPMVMVALYLIP